MGYGKVDGSFYPRLFGGRPQSLFVVYTNGSVQIRFGRIRDVPPFTSSEQREQLRGQLNEIVGWNLPPENLTSYPTAPIAALGSEDGFTGSRTRSPPQRTGSGRPAS